METEVRMKNTGLRGVKVADTKISYIDGENGILIYRGYRIEELAERCSFHGNRLPAAGRNVADESGARAIHQGNHGSPADPGICL